MLFGKYRANEVSCLVAGLIAAYRQARRPGRIAPDKTGLPETGAPILSDLACREQMHYV